MADAGLLADADRHAGVGVAAVDAGNILLVQVDAVGGMGGHRHASQGQWRQGHELEGTLLGLDHFRSEEHTSELQSLMRISYAVFCLKKKKHKQQTQQRQIYIVTSAHSTPNTLHHSR